MTLIAGTQSFRFYEKYSLALLHRIATVWFSRLSARTRPDGVPLCGSDGSITTLFAFSGQQSSAVEYFI